MKAKEFRNEWVKLNPRIVHIPSEHELDLMESYAAQKVAEYKEQKNIWFNMFNDRHPDEVKEILGKDFYPHP